MNAKKNIILCVDDEPKNLALLDFMLTPKGYEIVRAVNGREAMARIREQKIDLVLLDIMMPEMDGLEVCRMIKENDAYRNIPVIMLTALTSKQDRIRGIDAGAEDFISKPFDQEEVLARIRMLLKVRGLNDSLNTAYNNITNLTALGKDIIKTFNPMDFDLISKIDGIIERTIRSKSDMADKPQAVLVRLSGEKNRYKWYQYEYVFDRLQRNPIELEVSLKLQDNDSKLFFGNELVVETKFGSLMDKLKAFNIQISNMVCYLSNALCIFAINYGREVSKYDAAVLESLVLQTLFLRSLSSQVRETEDAFAYTVHALARAAEANDEDTGNHILRVGHYCTIIAKKLDMPDKFINEIRLKAQLHDVGKVHVPSHILRKSGKLTPAEWEEIKKHPVYGSNIIGNHSRLRMGNSIAMTHHERWDGSGYPNSLGGEQIPIAGRIMNIADQYDALRNARAYKPAFDHATAFKIIAGGDGRTIPQHFDPRVLNAFKEIASKFEEVYERLKD